MDLLKRIFGMQNNMPAKMSSVDLSTIVILDVRTADEYQAEHVKGAKNIDFYAANFQAQISKLDKNKSYVLYCRSGNRSGQATHMMKQLGFQQAENFGSLNQASKRLGIIIE